MEMLEKTKRGMDLTFEEATILFDEMLLGNVEEPRIEAILLALAEKGETEEEIAAAAQVMLSHAIPVDHTFDTLLDTCGTGGDGSGSFNISTAAAILCSLFVPVAKHGNRAMSSKSGSADVLEALGVPIDLGREEASRFLTKKNFVFLFAQKFHPAMKSVATALIGIFNEDFMARYMGAIEQIGIPNVMVVSSKDGLDEVSISDITTCYHKKGASVRKFTFDPREFGIYAGKETIQGYEAQTNAELMKEVFLGRNHSDLTNAIAINAAFSLTLTEVEKNLRKAFLLARETIKSGKVLDKLAELSS